MTDHDMGDLFESIDRSEDLVETTTSDDISTQILDEFRTNLQDSEEVDEAVVDAIDRMISDESFTDTNRIVTDIISAIK